MNKNNVKNNTHFVKYFTVLKIKVLSVCLYLFKNNHFKIHKNTISNDLRKDY